MSRGENSAKNIRKRFGLTTISYDLLEDLSYALGAYVDYKEILGSQGRIIQSKITGKALIVINSAISYQRKKKFILAHEIGHFVMHKNDKMFICDESDFVDWGKKNRKETEANEFASELLMPREIILDLTTAEPLTLDLIIELSNKFGTSITATLFQYARNGPIPCCVTFSRDGIIEWFVKSIDFDVGYLRNKTQVPLKSVASDYFLKGKLIKDKEVLLAKTWFEGNYIPEDLYLYEQCHFISSINSVVSLIWICEDY